tara:strand:- start:44 stop:424 length:381 start_codon:yes stop_codon:yes gene_type:complete
MNTTKVIVFPCAKLVLLLLASVFLCGCGNSSNFRQAAADGDLEAVKNSFSAGDINSQDSKNGYTPLHLAVSNDHKAVVKFLVDNGAEINKLNYRNETALDLSGTESTDRFLRKHGGKTAAELKNTN